MHTLQVKLSNECGINYVQATLENRADACAAASRQAASICESATGSERAELVKAFYNGLQNVRML